MRLICPNCGAQYEVPDEVIPKPGRDVQCSNCGDTWFQNHPDHQAPAQDPEPAPEAEPEQPGASEGDGEVDTPEAPRRQLDPAIADVLREEAKREREARAAETGGLETQPDLGLTQDQNDNDKDRRTRESRARMARLRGESEDQTPGSVPDAEDIAPSSRRNLLPDIDEINSSLDASPSAPKHEPPEPEEWDEPEYAPRRRSGFKRGFVYAVLLGSILLAVYAYASQIAESVPTLAGPLETYVEKVNELRVLIDERFGWVREWVREMSSPANTAE